MRKITIEDLSVGSIQVALYIRCEGSETAPAYRRRVNSELAIVKKVNKSCRATVRLIQLAGKKLVKIAQLDGFRYF